MSIVTVATSPLPFFFNPLQGGSFLQSFFGTVLILITSETFAKNSGLVLFLVLLDLSPACEIVNHSLLCYKNFIIKYFIPTKRVKRSE